MPSAELIVTGATGRIGQILQTAWQDNPDFRVLWLDRRLEAPRRSDPDRAFWDLDRPLPKARLVLHLAAATRGDPATLSRNAALAEKTARAAHEAGAEWFMNMSSAAVYGATSVHGVFETAPQRPTSDYGRSKRAAEMALNRFARSSEGPRLVHLRLGNLVGADRLIGEALPQAKAAGRPVALDRFEDGSAPLRSTIGPVSLAIVLGGLVRMALDGKNLAPVLNLAAPRPVGLDSLLEAAGARHVWRPASRDVPQAVVLRCEALETLGLLPEDASSPERMVMEWKDLRVRMVA